MKKVCLFTAAVAFMASLGYGQTVTQVVSRNAVGYVKLTVPANGFVMASVPFNAVGSTKPRTITELFGDQLTGAAGINPGASDKILKFIASSQSYDIYWKSSDNNTWRDFTDFFNPTTNTLAPGEAFYLSSVHGSNQTVFMMGEVPDRFTVPTGTSVVSVIQGFNQIGYSFPTDVAINSTTLGANVNPGPLTGDILARFDVATQRYLLYWYDNGTFFPPFDTGWKTFTDFLRTTDRLFAAEGVFLERKSATPFTWKETKPYTWP